MQYRNIILTAFFSAILLSCNTRNEEEVLQVAEPYIKSLAEYDIESARPYATQETIETLLDKVEKNILPSLDTNYIKQNTNAEITIQRVEFASDTSATVFYNKKTQIQNTNTKLEMRYRNGKWLAHQPFDSRIKVNVPTTSPEQKMATQKK